MRSFRTLALGAAGILVLAVPATVAASTPVQDGCPAAAEVTSVAYLEALGDYGVPRRIDDPANGGNGDGYVCAFPLPGAVSTAWNADVDPIFQFFENNLPADGRP